MYTASDILEMLKMLDDELKSKIKDAEPKTHDSPYNMGFAVGLYSARMLIHDIFEAVDEEKLRVERMIDAIVDILVMNNQNRQGSFSLRVHFGKRPRPLSKQRPIKEQDTKGHSV